MNDLTQVKSGIADIKTRFDNGSCSNLEIRIDNASQLEGPMIFLQKVASKFDSLGIALSSDVGSQSLQRLVSYLANRNVEVSLISL